MLKNIVWIWLMIMAVACSQKPAPAPQDIMALKEMNELVSVEYVVNKIIKASDDKTWYKVGDRKILMTCQATLKAGIDFSKLDANKTVINGKSINLTLPHATLFSLSIRPEDITVAYQDVSMFRSGFSVQEKDQLASQAEAQIKASVDSLGILQTAETNASLFVSNFLRQLGYEKISIQFSNDSPSPQKLN